MCIDKIIPAVLLGINSIQDVRKKEIFLIPTAIGAAGGFVFAAFSDKALIEILISYLPGIMLLFLAGLLKGQIGLGDALQVAALGGWMSTAAVFCILIFGFFAAGIFGGMYRLCGGRNQEMPLVPFLLLGNVLYMIFS